MMARYHPLEKIPMSTFIPRRNAFSRKFSTAGLAAGAVIVATVATLSSVSADLSDYIDPAEPALPPSTMQLDMSRAALVVIDPQVDFLSPDGVTWGVVGESVTEHDTVENIDKLFKLAKANEMVTAVSPHYYYPHDHSWKFEGALEKLMHAIGMFDRKGPLELEGFDKSGADWMPQYKQYINDGETIVVSPHKVFGPETNDLVLQLRKRGIDQIVLAGMSANLCVESHMRELQEQGFEVAVVRDATAAAKLPEGDGYAAALVNFRFMANALWTTDEVTQLITAAN